MDKTHTLALEIAHFWLIVFAIKHALRGISRGMTLETQAKCHGYLYIHIINCMETVEPAVDNFHRLKKTIIKKIPHLVARFTLNKLFDKILIISLINVCNIDYWLGPWSICWIFYVFISMKL